MLDEAQSNESSLARKLQQIESEVKSLKRELNRRTAADLTASRRSATTHTPPDQSFAPQVSGVMVTSILFLYSTVLL